MLHVVNEVTIDTCDIHQIKENAEVKSNRWLSIQTICGSSLVHKINSTHAAIVKTWSSSNFLSSELIICHSFLQGQMMKAALSDYPSIWKPLYYLKYGTRNLPFSFAYRRSFLAFSFCWLEVFRYHKRLFGMVFQLNLDY